MPRHVSRLGPYEIEWELGDRTPLLIAIRGPGLPTLRLTKTGPKFFGEDLRRLPKNGRGLLVFGYEGDRPEVPVAEPPIGRFGEILKQIRQSEGFTIAHLAHATEVPRQTIHRIEKGQREPSLRLARRLAAALGKSLSIFDNVDA